MPDHLWDGMFEGLPASRQPSLMQVVAWELPCFAVGDRQWGYPHQREGHWTREDGVSGEFFRPDFDRLIRKYMGARQVTTHDFHDPLEEDVVAASRHNTWAGPDWPAAHDDDGPPAVQPKAKLWKPRENMYPSLPPHYAVQR